MEKLSDNVWVEKYRPQFIKDIIVQDSIRSLLQDIIDKKNLPHLLFYGNAGTGKTSSAKAIVNELGADCLFINASADRGIDTIKIDIENYTSKVSIKRGLPKIVILDESNLTKQAYEALRGNIEKNHSNARFIITTNYPEDIPDPIMSRFCQVSFGDDGTLIKQFAKHCQKIWETETGKELTKDQRIIFSSYIKKMYPEMRKTLNGLQIHIMSFGFFN